MLIVKKELSISDTAKQHFQYL